MSEHLLAALAATYGAGTGLFVRARLRHGVHRRPEETAPLPGFAWVPWAGALAAGALALVGPPGPYAAALVALVPLYVALAAVDVDVHRLPRALTLPAYPLAAVLLFAVDLADPASAAPGRAAVAGAVLWLAFAVLSLLSRGQLGRGDVTLAGPLGAFLGRLSWERVAMGTYAMFAVGGVAALALLLARRADRHTRLAFGPAMLLGTLLALCG